MAYFTKRLLRVRAALVAVGVLALLAVLTLVVIQLTRPPRTNYEEELFQSVTYFRQARSIPRPLVIHIVEIDLSAPGIAFLVTPGDEASELELFASTTSAFLEKFDLQVAVNGSFFKPFHSRTWWDYYPRSGDPVDVSGLAISNSDTYSEDEARYLAKLCITNDRVRISGTRCPSDTTQALAGNPTIVENGMLVDRSSSVYHTSPHPRTAIALDTEGKTLWLIVVDGRQAGYSEGVTLDELANIVLELGAETALNLDGGGSSTLVAAGRWGPRTLNAPIHTRIPMRQRPVANHLGVYAYPVETNTD